MNIKSKTAGGDPADSVDMKSTAHNYEQYTTVIGYIFLCDSILSKGGNNA